MEFITVRSERGSAILGRLAKSSKGWRFYPWMENRRPSQRYWPTAEEAIPRWLKKRGYNLDKEKSDGSQ